MKIYNRKIQMDRRIELRKNATPAEKTLWNILRKRNINNIKFYRQYGIGVYIADFYAPSIRLCIEVDGKQHHSRMVIEYDAIRDNYMKSLNITVLRFDNELVIEDMNNVVEKVKEATESLIQINN
ncbi:MAG: endonuclease domain-containing protein [Candidatus Tenebribacter burtonii]|nr:endonuclease domain-containing protein [Candidatus Tenebribacter burtonii]